MKLNQVYMNSDGNYTNTFTINADLKYTQTFIQLTPIIMRKNKNYFGFSSGYTSEILVSPLTNTIRLNETLKN